MSAAGTFMVGAPSIRSNAAAFRGSLASRRTIHSGHATADGYIGATCDRNKTATDVQAKANKLPSTIRFLERLTGLGWLLEEPFGASPSSEGIEAGTGSS